MEAATTQDKKIRVQITEQELLCKKGCGFYGTPQWNGLCSKCWRMSLSQQKKTTIDHHKNRSLLSSNDEPKNDSRSSRFKSLLRKSPSMFSSSPSTSDNTIVQSPSAVPHSSSSLTLKPTNSNRDRDSLIPNPHEKLYKYAMEYFGLNAAKDIDRHCRGMLEKIFENARAPLDDISESVQTFYQGMKEHIGKLKLIKEDDFNQGTFMAEVEEYICTEAYDIIFSDRADEEAADLSIQDRIRSLNWVTSGFLETAFDFSILSVHNYIDEAVTYIIDLNQYRSAREKLNCLVLCSQKIFEALKESRSGAPASADEFLPALIYVILHANPPLILSNMKFISRFALPSRIMRGESGYYFTNLSCSLQFIQDMNAESLRMDKEEFEAYTSGRLGVPLNNRESDRNMAIKTMEKGLKLFDDLLDAQSKLDDNITAFSGQMEENCEKYSEHVNTLLAEHPSQEVRDFCKTLRDPVPSLSALIQGEPVVGEEVTKEKDLSIPAEAREVSIAEALPELSASEVPGPDKKFNSEITNISESQPKPIPEASILPELESKIVSDDTKMRETDEILISGLPEVLELEKNTDPTTDVPETEVMKIIPAEVNCPSPDDLLNELEKEDEEKEKEKSKDSNIN